MSLLRIQQSKKKLKVQLGERNQVMAKKKLIKGLWSKKEIALLKKLFPNNSTEKIAGRLGRSLDTVKKKASSAL
jgi:hypothetical protein